MKIKQIFTLSAALLMTLSVSAQTKPTIDPIGILTKEDGSQESGALFSGPAPLTIEFRANAENTGGYSAYYEWRFRLEGEDEPYLVRYEEDTSYTFLKAGTHNVVLYATFVQGTDTVFCTQEYWETKTPIKVTVSESLLEMPNAFSPNGDTHNDVYRAKKYQSLVEFHAYIFNRWGQKLYEWTDPAEGWDGTYNGKDVKEGVYFVLVKAKGADGREYNIRRDVNLLRGFTERAGNSNY